MSVLVIMSVTKTINEILDVEVPITKYIGEKSQSILRDKNTQCSSSLSHLFHSMFQQDEKIGCQVVSMCLSK